MYPVHSYDARVSSALDRLAMGLSMSYSIKIKVTEADLQLEFKLLKIYD